MILNHKAAIEYMVQSAGDDEMSVSKTFLYDPKHSHVAEQIRAFRQTNAQSVPNEPKNFKQK